jgi:2-polyprenyl-3-methyl-5-hydroxy-6-metoxy-1,4-benzoquinol methylase
MAERRLHLIKGLMETTQGNILDFGCGTGVSLSYFAKCFPERKFLGLDTDAKFIEFARKNYASDNVQFINDSIINFKGPFGFIYSIDVLHHVDEMNSVIRQVYCIMEPGAEWLVIEPNILNPKVFLNQFLKKDERLFFQRKTEKIFENAGFTIVRKGLFLLIPYQSKKPSNFLKSLESRLERFFGGSVFYLLEK